MELLIRSQDKEALTKVNISIMYFEDAGGRNCIANRDNATGMSILGAYKTKERALEVLDEIQRHIAYIDIEISSGNACNISYDEYVYEMPKE